MNDFHKPVLILIAVPNGSGKTSVTSKILHHEWMEDSILLFRLAKGRLVKQYVEMIPEWASPIYSSDF